jgi:hypothetical protein
MIAWLMDPMRLRAMFDWWPQFEQQQHDVKEMYRMNGIASTFTRQKTFTKEGEFMHYMRIPSRLDVLFCKLDPELDGTNMAKVRKLLRDYPIFDIRVRGKGPERT